ncbi:hypothetical protein AB5I41_14635 [Sphingomonas sp. MMS24-JH45]
MTDWIATAEQAADAARTFATAVRHHAAAIVSPEGRIDPREADREQRLVHGLAWVSTVAEALHATAAWAAAANARGSFGETEVLVLRVGLGEIA